MTKRIISIVCLFISLFTFASCKVKEPATDDIKKQSENSSNAIKYKTDKQNEDYIYSIEEDGITLVKYIGESKDVIIPQSIDGRCVVEIGNSCFADSDITTLTISRNVATIQNFAFYRCEHLETLIIKNGVKCIGGSAFAHCISLQAIDFPESVTEIKECAFSNCTGLSSVAFVGKRELTIGAAAFSNTCIDSLMLPEGTKNISNAAFLNCKKLTKAYIPESISEIKKNAFKGCSKVVLYVSADSYGESFAKTANESYKVI